MGQQMDFGRFRRLLDDNHNFPCEYTFKFVIPKDQEPELLGLLPLCKLSRRFSAAGNYVSITAKRKMTSSDEVVSIYQKVATIPGIIQL